MKLKMPEGLEKSFKKEKLSPTKGHPMLPGISSIAFGEVHKNRTEAERKKMRRRTKTMKILNPIICHSF